MTTPQFVHLRIHSEYSIVDSLIRINDIITAAVKDNQVALAITDLSNLSGAIKFYRAAWSNGIKPIIGCDVWITNLNNRNKPSRLLLLAKNHHGYLQLCNLLTRAWLTNLYHGRAEINIQWLAQLLYETSGNNLIALSGAHFGNIGVAIDNANLAEAERCAQCWSEIFPNAFYIEIQRAGQTNMEMQVHQSLALATRLKLPVVATHPVQFLSSEEFVAHEVRTCIAEGEILANPRRIKRFKKQQNFKTHLEMVNLFSDLPNVIRNTIEIAKRCSLILQLGKPQLPNFSPPNHINIDDFLVIQAKAGLEKRLCYLYPDKFECEKKRHHYETRLKFETDTIIQMGFSSYFLIVADFIQWAKNNNIPVGPGRGSGASSLVAYSLLITDLDPLAYNLLFERFLNPERVSMPDFDIDFCQEGRDRVIQYVKERYGKEAVSQIATFGTMAAKGAVRDVGRVLDLSYNFCNSISKLIPFKPGKLITIIDAIEEEPLLKERLNNEEEVKQLLDLAQQVEGIVRNIGMHAGGVVIAPDKLTNFCPLYIQAGATAGIVSQYDKDDVEAVGLVKFDFLGLTTLTILNRAVDYIHQLDSTMADFNLINLPMNDYISYTLLSKAKTVAVFQLESRGMQSMLKEARPDRFEDIIALVALYRPGPIDLISDFCRRKHGEKFTYLDPRMETILSETYGIMVYQEQVMQMAQVVGGYSLGSADLLRRAMGKKKPDEMAKHRLIFRNGAAKDGLTQEKADEIFDLMEKFAGYGFNKSHAAAYALLSYYTAYLKAHHPAAFMAANLSLAMDDTDKIKVLIEDAINVCGLNILPPDINQSDYFFIPVALPGKQAMQIRYGLGAIKGSGQNAVEAIMVARQNSLFINLFDFANRVDKRQINRRIIDALIRAGAFDCFNQDRAVLQASISLALNNAAQLATFANQVSLFDNNDFKVPLEYVRVSAWTNKQRLKEEKNVLGFYFSGHLFDAYDKEIRQFVRTKISTLESLRGTLCLIAGIIILIRTQFTQRGGKLLIITLDDGSAIIDVIIYNELLELNKFSFKEDELLIIQGKISEDRFSGNLRIIAEKVMDIDTARIKYGQRIVVSFNKKINPANLRSTLLPYRQAHGLLFVIKYIQSGIECEVMFGDSWRILPSDDLKTLLKESFNQEKFIIEY